MTDARDEYIRRTVRGRSFADIGGLWGTVNEKVSVAHAAGAAELTMIDITVEGGELWKLFEQRMRTAGISGYRCVSTDICAVQDQRFDVVHCSGVLYHHPNPQTLLAALRRATGEHLVLSSAVTRSVIENRHGRYEIPPSGVILVPALNDAERAILGAYWKEVGAEAHGITAPARFHPSDFGPWWWLPTATAMGAMARAAGFDIVDHAPIWGGNAHTYLLAPSPDFD